MEGVTSWPLAQQQRFPEGKYVVDQDCPVRQFMHLNFSDNVDNRDLQDLTQRSQHIGVVQRFRVLMSANRDFLAQASGHERVPVQANLRMRLPNGSFPVVAGGCA